MKSKSEKLETKFAADTKFDVKTFIGKISPLAQESSETLYTQVLLPLEKIRGIPASALHD